MNTDQNAFWRPKSAQQIAAEQGITQPRPLDQLFGAARGLWDDDEEFDQFLASIDRNRREHTSA